ncbi:MAG: hypothetical protein Q9186_006041 [Xanthomendoza sp. 1 TL-2023]
MPRTLPWLKDQRASQSKSTRAPPAKNSRARDPNSDSSDNARSLQRAKARQRRELAQRAGLSHDDIYIMVEDEFLSTAQLFTSHLHHAEYIRLKNAARARNANSNSILQSASTSTSIPRPTDSITAMRAETKKKKEAEARTGKNKAALDRMKEDAKRGIAVSSDDDNKYSDNDDDDEEADKAPWAGTSLQGLMAPDTRKNNNLTSLSGLQGIQSSTRAAKGFAKPESQSARDFSTRPTSSTQPIITNHIPISTHHPYTSSSSSSSSNDDDDLDAPPRRLPPPSSKHHHLPPTTKPKPKPTNPLTLAAQDLFHKPPHTQKNQHPNPSPPPQPPRHESPTSSPPSRRNAEIAAAARRKWQERRERAAAARKKDDDGGGGGGGGGGRKNGNVNNVNEIPIFLV